MSYQAKNIPVGEVRPSQLLYTFGVGALIDLPHISAMILGIDHWNHNDCRTLGEERLLHAVQRELGPQVTLLRQPPLSADNPHQPFEGTRPVGIPVVSFPRWLVCPLCRQLLEVNSALVELKHDPMRPDRTYYVHRNCAAAGNKRAIAAIPARFLTACESGHLDDFPWHYFVHKGQDMPRCGGILKLVEPGISGEASDIYVLCEGCRYQVAARPVSDAFDRSQPALPACRGRHPHLKTFSSEPCDQPLRAISLGASNSWFGVTLSVLSLPETTEVRTQAVEAEWNTLQNVKNKGDVTLLRSVNILRQFFTENPDDDEIWAAIEAFRAKMGESESRSLKVPEWAMFCTPETAPQTKYFQIKGIDPPAAYRHIIDQVVLVERLREVRALIGFTRISSPGDLAEEEEERKGGYAPLSQTAPEWVPANEVHGEGIFLQFNEEAIRAWSERPELAARSERFLNAHRSWRVQRRLNPALGYQGLRYVLLHTFAHALMRQLALSCGYAMASIRERIYALEPTAEDGPMAGILFYTAAADSEGTLGGLVSLGQPEELGMHIQQALESMRLCASDPLCAEHAIGTPPGILHGAACHACMFVPETSCESGNRYLDRSLLIPTLEHADLAFFEARP